MDPPVGALKFRASNGLSEEHPNVEKRRDTSHLESLT